MLGLIGAGRMASAILEGVLAQGLYPPEQIIISNPHQDKLERPRSQGVHVTTENRAVAQQADIVILAVKPQKFEPVLQELADLCAGKCVVSIAAGISTDWICARLPGAFVVRVMPNTPLQLGFGMTAVAQAPQVPQAMFQQVCDIFQAAGAVSVVPEAQMDEVVALSGSSPAFFFRMADVMTAWAQEHGMDAQTAVTLTAATMRGAAEMLLRAGKTPEELTKQVCSPGGTTLAALTAFDDGGFEAMLTDALNRCSKRSKELGQ
ncbi:MAG: pyrroline-5-carboxylate reductase [Oscillospiraceae bacterium]|nr:pyrroline-5-carboxylate reductase [Oscillospiraceae bacterium]